MLLEASSLCSGEVGQTSLVMVGIDVWWMSAIWSRFDEEEGQKVVSVVYQYISC